ncbi:MAG: site-specific DNA-methyltransferase, partial [Elusimicrobia bacterium]|nr:site-specific DNA-methyltransferase [Elusimicrobiota bacterium]
MKNALYYGDNLKILKQYIKDNSIDLIYLDPPFQSGKNYNRIFQPEKGDIKGEAAQIKAFEDTWKWGAEAEKNFKGLITGEIVKEKPNQKLIELMKAMRGYLGDSPIMAYLAMMAPRLLEM